MPGPLPNPDRRRRNAPTIPTTKLPASGRKGRPPNCPYDLAAPGAAWWKWAWMLPQAAAWSKGDLYVAARRAQLEDDITSLGFADELDLSDLLAGADPEAAKRVEYALTLLKRCAGGALAVKKEMRELDAKLGLTPESMAKLRWTIVDDELPATPTAGARTGTGTGTATTWTTTTTGPAKIKPAARHLRAVDPLGGAAGQPIATD